MKTEANVFWSSFSGKWTGTRHDGEYQVFYYQWEAEKFAGVEYVNE